MFNTMKILALTGVCAFSLGVAAGCGDDTDGAGGGTTVSSTTTSSTTTGTGTGGGGDGGAGGAPADECKTDICAVYGAAVPQVASGITDAAATDPKFQDDFAPLVAAGPDAVQAFKTSLANFIATAYGCDPDAYTGKSMVEAHRGMNITQEDYDAFITLIAGVLAANGVAEDDIKYCFAPPLVDPAFSSTIVGQ